MKSQQPDRTIKTNCKNCAFAVYDSENKTQTGCFFNRVDKFQPDVIEAYDNDKQFFVINRLCTYFRDKAWGYSLEDAQKVTSESSLSFDLIFDCNTLDQNGSESILNFLNSCNYDPKKLTLFFVHESDKYNKVKDYVSHIARNTKYKTNISIYFDIDEYMHQLVMATKNSYHAIIKDPADLNPTMLNDLNGLVNDDLKRFIVAKYNNITLLNSFIYKSGYHIEHRTYSKLINTIIDQSKETNMYVEI